MHIPDGFLSTPVWTGAAAVSAGAIALAVRKTAVSADEKRIPLMGVTGAFIFAAQMVNFPIAVGTSGHLVGGVLAMLLLGPWASILVMSAILIVQALLFQDGGITALGANILNMGVVSALCGYASSRILLRFLPGTRGAAASGFVGAWLAVVAGSALASVEIALSGTAPLTAVLPAMTAVHALIGIVEGLITSVAFAFIARARPDLSPRPALTGGQGRDNR
jgi:cobalt/nickel transport system permease protein